MRKIFWLMIVMLLMSSWLALASVPTKEELVGTPQFIDATQEPVFKKYTEKQVRDSIRVVSNRSYAFLGFNIPNVQVYFPETDNSGYSKAIFEKPRLLDKQGREVDYDELQEGIYDHDFHLDEIRFIMKDRNELVEFTKVLGKLTVRYPLLIETLVIRQGEPLPTGVELKIDGPYVTLREAMPEIPEENAFSKIEPIRAYDNSGRRLKRDHNISLSMSNGIKRNRTPYWGKIAEVRIDVVRQWGELAVTYDLPAADLLPKVRIGTAPVPGKEMDDWAEGKVNKKIIVSKPLPTKKPSSKPLPVTRAPAKKTFQRIAPEEAKKRLKKNGYANITKDNFVMSAAKGKTEVVALFLSTGLQINSLSRQGMTPLSAVILYKHNALALMLIAEGADVNVKDSNDSTPLLQAVSNCKAIELVDALIKAGADVNAKAKGGVTPLEMAGMFKCEAIITLLKKAGAS